ncbi:unnamed protein product [Phytomonas sp. EM1]|nr:unnamed protein product [Phytomonas sp. EM1]|eukprot:CCW64408.1 unnamed protein product [Phytomonas sp. isolate EM1]
MHGADLENCRFVVQPREIKFTLSQSNSESQITESTGWRGAKGVLTSRAYPSSVVRSFKPSDPLTFGAEEVARRAERAQTQHQTSPPLLHRTDLGENLDHFLARNEAMRTASMRVARRVRGGMELKRIKKNPKPLRSPRVFANPQPQAAQSLFVEGSSMLAQDAGHASQALKHLSDCVAEERHLRDALEKAKDLKLKAFREVTRIYLSSLDIAYSPSAAVSAAKPARSLFQNPDRVSLARCAVVSNTLLSTIQTYMRCWQSSQLIASLRGFRHLNSKLNFISNSDITSFFSTRPDYDERMDQSASRLSSSLEDLLDMEEINKLKQLYFDYFDCEIVELDSTESSELGAYLKSDSTSTSLASLLEISITHSRGDASD